MQNEPSKLSVHFSPNGVPKEHKKDVLIVLPIFDNQGTLGCSRITRYAPRKGVAYILAAEARAYKKVTRLSARDRNQIASLLARCVDSTPTSDLTW